MARLHSISLGALLKPSVKALNGQKRSLPPYLAVANPKRQLKEFNNGSHFKMLLLYFNAISPHHNLIIIRIMHAI
jgi:hypothetical protein